MEKPSINRVIVCGSGLAFEMTLAALASHLPDTMNITAVELEGLENHDGFYGYLTAPTAFNFLLSLGLDEPSLILKTQTNLAYGTAYENWAGGLNWAQCFHEPFPVWDAIQFHHYAVRVNAPFPAFLVNSVAGLNGRFAHPPTDPQSPLSQAEYGYVFDPREFTDLLKKSSHKNNINRLTGAFAKIQIDKGTIISLDLRDGRTLGADFLIDCSGFGTPISYNSERSYKTARTLSYVENRRPVSAGMTFKHVKANAAGWESIVRLQRENIHLAVGLPEEMPETEANIDIGYSPTPWFANYVAIGHAACVAEPLTPAPMIILQRDIERLLSLFPISENMSVESCEYNRLFNNDREHCDLFFRSMFEIENAPSSHYWDSVRSIPPDSKLLRKIKQFRSRGFVTMYDLEPFNAEDWIIQHFGLSRKPLRYDVCLDQISENTIGERLGQLSANINSIVQKMPPGDRYIQNFRRYLEKKHGG